MAEWKEYELNQICSRLSSGKGLPAKKISDSGKYPVYGGNGLRGYTETANFEGDCAIIGRQGAYCGNVRYFSGTAYMTEHAVVTCANENNNTRYLSYLLSTMNLGRLSGQSAQPGLSVKTLGKQVVKVPPLTIQNKIVSILAALDTKIEDNEKINKNLRVYASQIQFNWGSDIKKQKLETPEEYAEVTRKCISEGYDCVKVDPILIPGTDKTKEWNIRGPLSHYVLETVYNRVAAIRETGGDDLDIIIEMHSNSDTLSAIQIAKVLEPLRIFYYEEPAHPLNVENFVEIKKKTDMSLASGERIYTRLGYRQFFEKRCLDVIQPDLCLCGGLSEAKKICDMAWAYDAHVQIHVCGSPISKAAALQIEAAIPNFLIHEHHQRALDPVNRATCKYDYQPVNGRYKVPDLPGIGQEPAEDVLQKAEIHTIAKYLPYMR